MSLCKKLKDEHKEKIVSMYLNSEKKFPAEDAMVFCKSGKTLRFYGRKEHDGKNSL